MRAFSQTWLLWGGLLLLSAGGVFWGVMQGASKQNRPAGFQSHQLQLDVVSTYIKDKQFSRALRLLESMLKKRPRWPEALLLLRQVKFELGNEQLLRKAIALKVKKKWKKSFRAFGKVSASSLWRTRAIQEREDILVRLNAYARVELAAKNLQKAVMYNLLLLELFPQHRDAEKRQDELLKIIESTHQKSAHKQLSALINKEKRRRKIRHRRRRKRKRFRSHKKLIRLMAPKVRAPVARPVKKVVTKTYPTLRPPVRRRLNWNKYCRGLYNSGRLRRARYCYKELLDRNEKHAVAHYMLGSIYTRLGYCSQHGSPRFDMRLCVKANDHFKRFVTLDPTNPTARKLRRILRMK
ncbi:MAG: hypothetical protein CL920_26315 [Deltaproteobacteria bacterium]|nr:hypothetical protein [Deltaproteobacteria bacterium]